MRADRASRRATGGPFGNVSGGRNLALAPLRHRVFPGKFLMQFGLDVHLVVPRGFWKVPTWHAKVRAPRTKCSASSTFQRIIKAMFFRFVLLLVGVSLC